MSVVPPTGLVNARRLPWTLVGAGICLILYALVLVIQPEVLELMGIELGGRARARMMARVLGAFIMVWGLFEGARWAWWVATAFTVLGSITGVLGVIFVGRFGQVHLLADTIIAPIGVVAIMTAATFLLLPQTRAVFRTPPA